MLKKICVITLIIATILLTNTRPIKADIVIHHFKVHTPTIVSGFLDRIVDGKSAVLLMETIGEEVVIPIEKLPPESEENTWFYLLPHVEPIKVLAIDKEKTEKESMKSKKLQQLLQKSMDKLEKVEIFQHLHYKYITP